MTTTLTSKKLVNKRNHFTEKQRSDAGRLGKGEDAFTPKDAAWWKNAQKRIEAIAQREYIERMKGAGVDVIREWRHIHRSMLSARKF